MIALFRIDDRLIHAQVVIGWGRVLRPDRIVVANDSVAANEWEKNLYLTAIPPRIKVSILSLHEAVEQIGGGVFDRERIILLVKSPRDVVELLDLGLVADEVNVGGIHYAGGKTKVLDHVFLDDVDRSSMRELVKRGVTLEARAVPENEPVIMNSMVV